MRKVFSVKEENMVKDTDEYYQKKIADIPTEKGYSEASDKNAYIMLRTEEFEKAHKERESLNTERLNYQREFLLGAFRFFYPGRSVKFPTVTFEGGASYAPAVFIKFDIDFRKENPYAPSNVTLSFAIASGMKRVDLPMSGEFGSKIVMCKGESYSITDNYVDQWEQLTRKSQANRVTRYIVTGNVLQALAQDTYKGGTLVSYTVQGGGIKKGYLLPDSWQPNFNRENLKQEMTKIPVPVYLARKFIRKYVSRNAPVLTDTPLSFLRDYDGEFQLVVPMSMTQGGKFYKNLPLVKMTVGENFNKTGTFMMAVVANDMIDNVLEYLQNEMKVNAMITQDDFKEIKDEIPQSRTQEVRPETPAAPENNLLELELELEAEAALILLQLN